MTDRLAVLTREGTWFGRHVLDELARRGVRPAVVGVERTPFRARWRMARRLARRIGLRDATRYNARFWYPLVLQATGLRRPYAYDYAAMADRAVFAPDINAAAIAAAIAATGATRIVLAHSGIVRRGILDIPGAWVINAHPAALPRVRGVDVVRWSILEDVPPAVTLHVVDAGVDTGPILRVEPVPPRVGETLSEFERRITEHAARCLVEAAVAGPAAYPPAATQRRDEGRQYYLMPFRLHGAVERKFAAMPRVP